MLQVTAEVLVVVILVLANGALAGSEIALVSAGRGRLRARAEAGERDAARALELIKSPNEFLSTVQIGITLVGITAGAFGATALAERFAGVFVELGLTPRRAGALAIATVVAGVTYFTLVVGELVPKRLALGDPEGVATRVATPMRLLARLATPFVHILSWSTEFVLRLLPVRSTFPPAVTEEEIERLVAEATASGVIEKKEHDIVTRLFRLSDLTVAALMTPRESLVWLDLGAAGGEGLAEAVAAGHTRFLACQGGLDQVRGYVKVQDLLAQTIGGGGAEPRSVLRRPHRVRPWTPAFRVLERFQRSGDHIAIVIGSGGQVVGLVTLNDVLTQIVGQFPEPHEMTAPGAVRRADGSWLMDGLLSWPEALRVLGHASAAEGPQRTVHAFVTEHLGQDPSAADTFTWEGLRVEVVDMDGSRVDKVLVAPVFEEEGAG